GFLAVVQRLLASILLEEKLTKVGVRRGATGVKPHSLAECSQRLPGVAGDAEGIAEIVVNLGTVRLEAKGGAELFDGRGCISLGKQHQAEVVGRLGILGLKAESSLAAVGSLVELTAGPVCLAEVGMEGGPIGAKSHCPTDQVKGAARLPQLERDHP